MEGNSCVLFKVISRILPGRTEEAHGSSVMIAGLRAEIWTWDLQYPKQKC
jgi:hypothetical protein